LGTLAALDVTACAGIGDWSDKPIPAFDHRLQENRVLRSISQRAAYRKNVLLDGLRLDDDVGPYGFQQLIVRDQTAGVFNQISENRKAFGDIRTRSSRPVLASRQRH
jgi:hypothetical protein